MGSGMDVWVCVLLNAGLVFILGGTLYTLISERTSATPPKYWECVSLFGSACALAPMINFIHDLKHNHGTAYTALMTLLIFFLLSWMNWSAARSFYSSRRIQHLPEREKGIATRRMHSVVWAGSIVSTLLPYAINGYGPDYKMTWLGRVLQVAQFAPAIVFQLVEGYFTHHRDNAQVEALLDDLRRSRED